LFWSASLKADLTIGDFENPESIQQVWQAPRSIWGASALVMERTHSNVNSGDFALQLSVKGAEKNSWPYMEYRFPSDNNDLSNYKELRLSIFNPAEKTYEWRGYFVMPSVADPDKIARVYFGTKLKPGKNTIAIPLNNTTGVLHPGDKEIVAIDWRKVDKLQFYFNCPREDLTLFIDSVVLAASTAANREKNDGIQSAVSAKRTEHPPLIDGKLDDPVWKDAKWQEGFVELGTGKPADTATRFAVACDDRFLYVAFRCAEPNLDKLKARVTKRDDAGLYSDDGVELFVAPGPQRTDYYQFEVNPKGTVADAAGHQSGTVRDAAWNCALQVATTIGEGEWLVEMAVPLADMELGASASGDWGINVARVRRAGGNEQLSTFVPMTGSFQQPALFAALAMPDADFNALRWELPPPTGLTVVRENEATSVKGKLSIKNLTGKLRPVIVSPRLRHGDKVTEGKPVSDILDAGQSKAYEIIVPLPGDGPQEFEVQIADRRDQKALFARRTFAVNLEFKPISLTLRNPAYQSAIYATQKVSQISGNLGIAFSAKELEGGSVAISLSPEGTDAKPLAETKVEKISSTVDFKLPLPTLVEGRYRLNMTLLDASGKVISSLNHIIRKLSPAPSGVEWRIDENGILLRNGEPFLPVGWFDLTASALKEVSAGCNVTWLYIGPWQTVEDIRKRLDGIGAACGYAVIYPTVNNRRPEELTVAPITVKEAELIRQRVRALKNHPALLAWYLADEPEYHRVMPESVAQLRALISEEDPWHPTIVLNNTFGGIRQFVQGGDITAPDPYPFFKKGGVSSSMDRVGTFIAEAASCIRPGQTVWVVPQAYDTSDWGGKGERAPTFAESRNMVWQAVSAGARGVVWWDWNWVFPNTIDSVLGNAYLARELSALKNYVLAPVEGGLEITAPQKEMLRGALRSANGQKALFSANASAKPQDVVFKAPSLASRELVVLGEDRTVKVGVDGSFSDRFDVYGSHVYVTDAAFSKVETISAVQKKIDEANAARKQPGNLAFEDSGVMLRASSQGKYQPTPVRMVDGVRDGMGWKAMPFEGADWIELTWPQPQTIGRLAIYTDTLADFAVEITEGSDAKPVWRSIATVNGGASNPVVTSFDPVKTTRLRLAISKLRSGSKVSRIWEIEAYEK
jgi:hypothetical protein